MRILVLGGTRFVGRWIVQTALERGHQVTLFNRGNHPSLFEGVEELHGDREKDLSALEGKTWDAVVDTCGYVPRVERLSAQVLADKVGHYTFISSLSAYASTAVSGQNEEAPLGEMPDESSENIDEYYGPLKALCERVVSKYFPGRDLIVRPGLIVGPHDPTDRFTYWPHRMARGGTVLAPGRPERQVQWIDARDLVEWILRMVEQGQAGAFNANRPAGEQTMGDVLEACQSAAGSESHLVWAPDQFLLDQGLEPWQDLPLWIPESDAESRGFFSFDVRKAVAAGLTFRPVIDTVKATLEWDQAQRGPDYQLKTGIDPVREGELLDKFEQAGGWLD